MTCPCAFRLWTLAQNEKSHTEVLPRDPVYRDLRSCQDTSYGDLIQRHCVEVCCKDLSQVSYINLAQKAFVERESTEISYRDLAKRYLVQRSCQETSSRDLDRNLAKRSVTEILRQSSYRDLVQRSCQETSHGDLVQRLGEEGGGLARRSCRDTSNRDLTLRSLTKIFVEIPPQTPG